MNNVETLAAYALPVVATGTAIMIIRSCLKNCEDQWVPTSSVQRIPSHYQPLTASPPDLNGWLTGVDQVSDSCASHEDTSVSQHGEYYRNVILPHIRDNGFAGCFTSHDGKALPYLKIEGRECAPASIVLHPGRTESFLRYLEIVYDLRQLGLPIYMLEPRGQGLAPRLTSDPHKGHVEQFDDYVNDLHLFVQDVVRPAQQSSTQRRGKVLLLAHSMGGAISTRLTQRDPESVDAMVLLAPMLQIQTAPYSEWFTRAVTKTLCALGCTEDYVIGHGAPIEGPFEENTVSQYRPRYTMNDSLLHRSEYGSIAIGGPTNQWVDTSIEATMALRNDPRGFPIPTLMLLAGRDTFVINAAADALSARSENCRVHRFEEAKHEILQEHDELRREALDMIYQFLEEQSQTPVVDDEESA